MELLYVNQFPIKMLAYLDTYTHVMNSIIGNYRFLIQTMVQHQQQPLRSICHAYIHCNLYFQLVLTAFIFNQFVLSDINQIYTKRSHCRSAIVNQSHIGSYRLVISICGGLNVRQKGHSVNCHPSTMAHY